MKSTGIVRRVDDLGRVVIPKELRAMRDIAEGDSLEIFVDGKDIILRKYHPSCVFCNNVDEGMKINGKPICPACFDTIVDVHKLKEKAAQERAADNK